MNNLTYKGYTGTIEASIEDGCLHGQLLFITDIITYEGDTVDDIKISFEEAVDHYLAYCQDTGKPANKPYSGTFNVRVGQELHRKAVEVAYHQGITLNDFVAQSIKNAIEKNGVIRLEHTHQHNITITDNQTSRTVVATTDKPLAWEKFNAIQ
jgi:predicted HicB family RNase H-like nuclease